MKWCDCALEHPARHVLEQELAALAAERHAAVEAYALGALADDDLDATELRGDALRRHLAALKEALPALESKLTKLDRQGETHGERLNNVALALESLRAESSIAWAAARS